MVIPDTLPNQAGIPMDNGCIAVLDALGASTYSESEIARFLESRQIVLSLSESKAEAVLGRLDAHRLSTFTFNDTVVIAYPTTRSYTRLFALDGPLVTNRQFHLVIGISDKYLCLNRRTSGESAGLPLIVNLNAHNLRTGTAAHICESP